MVDVKSTLPILVAVFLPCLLWANAGGYFRGGVESSGTLGGFEPSQLQAVQILDENLTVDFDENGAEVDVRYVMRNETDRRVKVRFGFPIEESFDNDLGFGGGLKKPNPEIPRSASGYRVTAGRKALKANFTAENAARAADDRRFQGIAGWMVSEIVFEPREEIPLAVRFYQPFSKEVSGISNDDNISAKIFRYRLSTGGAWAGPIARGRIELRPKGVDPSDVKVLKPSNRFNREGSNWVWTFEGLEPALADDLDVQVVPAQGVFGRRVDQRTGRDDDHGAWVKWKERGGRWTMEHSSYRAIASSEKSSYSAGEIGDYDARTAWSEDVPGAGVGEWLELRPEVPKPLAAITIRPGFAASEKLFAANARPKTVSVELNGEHKFTASIPDRNEDCRIPVSGYGKPVKTVRLVFEDVWRGKKYDDLCVADVKLEAVVDKKPKIGDPVYSDDAAGRAEARGEAR